MAEIIPIAGENDPRVTSAKLEFKRNYITQPRVTSCHSILIHHTAENLEYSHIHSTYAAVVKTREFSSHLGPHIDRPLPVRYTRPSIELKYIHPPTPYTSPTKIHCIANQELKNSLTHPAISISQNYKSPQQYHP